MSDSLSHLVSFFTSLISHCKLSLNGWVWNWFIRGLSCNVAIYTNHLPLWIVHRHLAAWFFRYYDYFVINWKSITPMLTFLIFKRFFYLPEFRSGFMDVDNLFLGLKTSYFNILLINYSRDPISILLADIV